MGRTISPVPEKFCLCCGKKLERKRYGQKGKIEDRNRYLQRKYCSLQCYGKWSEEEINRLKQLYASYTLPRLSEIFGRTKEAVANKCHEIGLKGKGQPNEIRGKLSREDILWLKLNYPYMSNEILGIRLNCGWRTIVRLARRYGLEKSPEFMKQCQTHSLHKAKESHLKNGTYPPKGLYSPNLQKGAVYKFKKVQ